MYIGPTGNVSQCGRVGEFGTMPYGNIQNQTFEELLHHPFRDEIKNRTSLLKETECKDCRYWMVCHGGCPLDAILTNGNLNTKAPHCDWVKPFLSEYFEPVSGLKIPLQFIEGVDGEAGRGSEERKNRRAEEQKIVR